MRGFTQLEKKYGITVARDDFYNPFTGKTKIRYKMYSADGCPWDKGMSKAEIIEECELYGDELLSIKKKVEAMKNA